MVRQKARRGITPFIAGVTAVSGLVIALFLSFSLTSAHTAFAASVSAPVAAPYAQVQVCGNGSAPDYGFSYDLQQAHWTVDWQEYVSEQTVTEVDTILDRLNEDFIAQTMILFKPQDQVGNRVNCAVHFLRYMKLGQPSGERKDNGFVFLIVVEPDRIDVHYGVGLGLPALTAGELTNLNRAAEEAYQTTHSMDQALLTLVQEFDTVARANYSPLVSVDPTPETNTLPALPSGPLGILAVCGQLCIGILFVVFIIWVLIQMTRGGIGLNRPGFGAGQGRSRWGGGFGGGSFGGGGSSGGSSTRGGSGSGRSGRGN